MRGFIKKAAAVLLPALSSWALVLPDELPVVGGNPHGIDGAWQREAARLFELSMPMGHASVGNKLTMTARP